MEIEKCNVQHAMSDSISCGFGEPLLEKNVIIAHCSSGRSWGNMAISLTCGVGRILDVAVNPYPTRAHRKVAIEQYQSKSLLSHDGEKKLKVISS